MMLKHHVVLEKTMAAKKPTASTQQHLDIEDIRDDIVILKNGNAVVVLGRDCKVPLGLDCQMTRQAVSRRGNDDQVVRSPPAIARLEIDARNHGI